MGPFRGLLLLWCPRGSSCIQHGKYGLERDSEAHVFITDLPGMKKDEVKIEVEEEKVLKISGQRTKGIEDKDNKWHRVERSTEKFLRKVKLPPNTTVDGAKAVLDNGVLTVTVPKENEKKDYVKLIPI
uniref:SHSP domain-containing protein n=1 Tax=Ananas comosus var. bracteatus TaxID=296719 RepID=A0A6V7NQK4_ANACO|nr:unnamed protein product [Ananas comosus var. bracteatus]